MELHTVELWVVIQGRLYAYENGIMHGSQPMGHNHALWAAEDELLSMGASNLSVQ